MDNFEQKKHVDVKQKKKYIPWFLRRRVSCAECGYCYSDVDYYNRNGKYFNCPKCKYRHSDEEFWEDNYFKWERGIVENFD